jgi:SHS2 domain-containing protein
LAGLFIDSAIGMNALTGIKLAEKPRIKRTFSTSSPDAESLLVAFLSELVFYTEQDRLGFDHFEIQFEGRTLKVEMDGASLVSVHKAIKAVTYHNLHIQQTASGYEVEIVFDV